MKPTIKIWVTDDPKTGEEHQEDLPSEWAICPTCRGQGHNSLHLGSFTQDDWEQESYEFKEDYLAGAYDKACEECEGSGKVLVPDESQCQQGRNRGLLERYYQDLREKEADEALGWAEMGLMREY